MKSVKQLASAGAVMGVLSLAGANETFGEFDPNDFAQTCTARTAIHCRNTAASQCNGQAQDLCVQHEYDGALMIRGGQCHRLPSGGWVYSASYQCVKN